MADLEDIKDLKEKIRNNLGLIISRVPEKTRNEFIEFANGEFAGDYGLLLRELWETYKHYQQIINSVDTKLDYLITMIKNQTSPKIEEKKMPKMLGRKLNKQPEVKE